MKTLLILLAVLSTDAFSAPSSNVVESCINAKGRGNVTATVIPTNNILQQDSYKPGYTANYTIFNGIEIGYAISRRDEALVFNKKVWPTKRAIILSKPGTEKRPRVHIELASWLMLKNGDDTYLCVVDNFDGLGRSGSFQQYHYAYILQTNKRGQLYFTTGKAN